MIRYKDRVDFLECKLRSMQVRVEPRRDKAIVVCVPDDGDPRRDFEVIITDLGTGLPSRGADFNLCVNACSPLNKGLETVKITERDLTGRKKPRTYSLPPSLPHEVDDLLRDINRFTTLDWRVDPENGQLWLRGGHPKTASCLNPYSFEAAQPGDHDWNNIMLFLRTVAHCVIEGRYVLLMFDAHMGAARREELAAV